MAADFWNRYEEDIERAANLNSTCFRLSLEWCRIEPVQGVRDESAITRYHEILDTLKRSTALAANKHVILWFVAMQHVV